MQEFVYTESTDSGIPEPGVVEVRETEESPQHKPQKKEETKKATMTSR